MGHNSVVSGHPKSTGIPRVDGLSKGPPDLGRHKLGLCPCHNFMGVFETDLDGTKFGT